MNSHTPGPWTLRGEFGTAYVYARGDRVSGVVAVLNYDWPGPEQCKEQRANAKLVTAAPELLDALKSLLDRYVGLVISGDAGNWDAETEDEVIAARAAIAKAAPA